MLALLGSAGILFLIIATTNVLTIQSKIASDFLPARETVLFVKEPDEAFIESLQQWFPLLEKIPVPDGIDVLALVQLPDESIEPILFARAKDISLPTIEVQKIYLPPFTILTTSEELVNILQNTEGKLSRYLPFHALRSKSVGGPWAYVDLAHTPLPSAPIDSLITDFVLKGSTFAAIAPTEKGYRFDMFGSPNISGKTVRDNSLSYISNPTLILHTWNSAEYWTQLLENLPEESKSITEGIIRNIAHNLFGNDVSWEYEILPLLQREETIELAYDANDTIRFAIHGGTSTPKKITTLLSQLHTSLQTTFNATEIRTRALDGRFTSRDIRMTDTPRAELKRVNGWQISETRNKDNSLLLVTALKGNEFVVSNTEEAISVLEDATSQNRLQPPVAGNTLDRSKLLATGLTDKKALQKLTKTLLSTMEIHSFFPVVGGEEAIIEWSLSEGGGLRTFRVYSSER